MEIDMVKTPVKTGKPTRWEASGDSNDYAMSKKYQWLPCDVLVGDNYSSKIVSYINNVHPFEDRKLYEVIEKIFGYFVPMFERVLTNYANPPKPRINISSNWYGSEPDWDDSDFDEDDYYGNRIPDIPITINKFVEPSVKLLNLQNTRLQVIVKCANIILTPENPEYKGGVWHIEGMKNESILASGIYYYHTENITESRLCFRAFVHEPEYEQNNDRGVEYVYGLENETGELNQNIGYIQCMQGKCIAFPNIYQHNVAPFRLEDPTKPGIRKILVFFLVDPTKTITSTATVVPQNPDWQADELMSIFNKAYETDGLPVQLSKNILDTILTYTNPMSLTEAHKHRANLMDERKFFINKNTKVVFERTVSLCEH